MRKNPTTSFRHIAIASAFATVASIGAAGSAHAFTQQQADDGKLKYNTHCATCHRPSMSGAVGPALVGDAFKDKWADQTVDVLRDWIHEFMPATAPKSLSDDMLDPIVSAILFKNGVKPDDKPLSKDTAKDTQFPK